VLGSLSVLAGGTRTFVGELVGAVDTWGVAVRGLASSTTVAVTLKPFFPFRELACSAEWLELLESVAACLAVATDFDFGFCFELAA